MKRSSEINRLGVSTNETEPIMWAVDDFLPVGLSVLTGGAKVGKSYLALNIALGVSTGGRVLGQFKAQKGGVLNLALEDTQRRLYPLTKNETGEWLSENSGTIGIADTADTIFVLERMFKSCIGTLRRTGRGMAEKDYTVKFFPQG